MARIPGTLVGDPVGIFAISCPASGSCVAGGDFVAGNPVAFVSQETHGTWGEATQIPGLAAEATQGSMINFVDCPSAGNCEAEGTFATGTASAPVFEQFVASESNGTWGTPSPIPGLAALESGSGFAVTGLSCASVGNCVVAGGSVGIKASDGTSSQPDGGSALHTGSVLGRVLAARRAAFGERAVQTGRPQAGPPAGSSGPPPGPAFVAAEVDGTWHTATVPVIPGFPRPRGSGHSPPSNAPRLASASPASPSSHLTPPRPCRPRSP